jgi:hypothetical protein
MKRLTCPVCGRFVYFDNLSCLNCGTDLVLVPRLMEMRPLAGAEPCTNRAAIGCNWEAGGPGGFCVSCALTEVLPDLSVEGNLRRWRRIEEAKRRLLQALLRLGLPLVSPKGMRLRFHVLADQTMPDGRVERVMTGHADGLVTLNVAEADDDRREAMRIEMGERYRTLLGHCRHEVGHFYFEALVEEGGRRPDFDKLFGDPDEDYQAALDRHYAEGPPEDWADGFVSAYATTHPWEDFAETFAHWMHMADGLDTAVAYGLARDADPFGADPIEPLVSAWVTLSIAMNAMSRSLGQPDLYPFVIGPRVVQKLGFVHDILRGRTA